MKILHFIPSIDNNAGITSRYMSVLCSECGKRAEIHVACGKSPSPIEIPNTTVHVIPCKSQNIHLLRSAWLKLLNEVKPDIVHVHGCWDYTTARTLRLSTERGFRTVLSPHGSLEPWIIKQHFYKEKLPKWAIYQWQAVRKAFVIHVMGEIEYENVKKFKWHPRIETVRNSLITNAVSNKEMAEAMMKLYRKVLDTEVYALMDQSTRESMRRLMHAAMTGKRINDFPELNRAAWRQIMIFAHTEGVLDLLIKGCELQPFAYPDSDVTVVDTFSKEKLKDVVEVDDAGDQEQRIYALLKLIRKETWRKRLHIKRLYQLAILLHNDSYDEAKLIDMLTTGKMTKFTGRIELILSEIISLEEGYMPVPTIRGFLTNEINRILINNLTI